MSVDSVYQKYIGLAGTIGKAAVSSMFPNDIELYIMGLDLVNSDGETEAYFVFPVQPFSINEQNKPIKSIKKTAGGITVLKTTTFSPTDTSIQGNFGRKFKFLLGNQFVNFTALLTQPTVSKPLFSNELDVSVKTGYGCCKVLEAIIKKSSQLDAKGKPYALYLYNLAIGNNYLVEITSLDFHQNQETNMIWHYAMTAKSLLPVESITSASPNSLTATLAANNVIQNGLSAAGNFLSNVL